MQFHWRPAISVPCPYAFALIISACAVAVSCQAWSAAAAGPSSWVHPEFRHLSSTRGELPAPNAGNQQTASLVLDVDRDGVNDFVITERTQAPSVVWYRRAADGWTRYVIEAGPLRIEAGGAFYDITGNGAPDIVFGGDSGSNEVWWWENPYPHYDRDTPWKRRIIKSSGANKHHDQLFGDFDGDGRADLVFWNQGARRLILAKIPDDPRAHTGEWEARTIYSYPEEEMEPRGTYPGWRRPHEHEGLVAADIDRDGRLNIVGGGRWFKHDGGGVFTPHIIDARYTFTRSAVGQFKPGPRPQVLLATGDGKGPLMMYEWERGVWRGKPLLDELLDAHSLDVLDFNGDGHLDVFVAEMQLGQNPNPKAWILFGDGHGGFTATEILNGFGLHEARIGDLTGNGLYDILAKPYTWTAPRIDLFLNQGETPPEARPGAQLPVDRWERRLIDPELPHRAIYVTAADLNGNGRKDIITGGWWYENPGHLGGNWRRHTIGAPLNNMAVVHDFDGDGHPDILGTRGIGAEANAEFVWARNDGRGSFTIHTNIPGGAGDFLQGVAVARFQPRGPLEIALSWHMANQGIQMLTVPANPTTERWGWRRISPFSQDEDLSVADINGNGLPDLFLGTQWLENPGNRTGLWKLHTIGQVTAGEPDRNKLLDFTGNGRLDAVVGLENGEDLLLFASPEDPVRRWTRTVIARGVGGGFSMDAGDLTGNGLPDVVLGEHRGSPVNRVLLYENIEAGKAWRAHVIDSGEGGGIDHHDGTQLFDLDGDGDLDIVSIGWYHPKLWVYENKAVAPPPGTDHQTAEARWHGDPQTVRPGPGDVFREYTWMHASGDAGGSLRVGGRLDYGGGPISWPQRFDLDHAVRAEIVIEKLLCHEGTRGLAISVNHHDWIAIPYPPNIPKPRWDYMHHTYPVVSIPLNQLKAGETNQFRLRVSAEHPWNWPQNLIYGVHARVYYDPKKPHLTGRLVSPLPGQTLGTNVILQAEASSPNGQIHRVDFVGHYQDVNLLGDGIYTQWQSHHHRAALTNHIGSVTSAPWRLAWDTSWIPDQPEPFQLAARVTDETGLIHFTEAIDGLTFQRGGLSVELCKPYEVPKKWLTRQREHTQKFRVTGDLSQAVAAQLVWVSWCPGYMEGLFLNDHHVLDREGPRYAYYAHRVTVPNLAFLRPGENLLRTGKTPLYDGKMVHGMEVNWPGIMVLIQYRK
jgi:hypothetical protein